QGTVEQRVLLVAADTHAPAQLGVAGEDRRLPPGAFPTQYLAQLLVQVDQTRGLAQALTVRRIADNQTGLPPVRMGCEGSQLALVDLDPFAQPGALDVVAQRLQQTRIGLVAANPRGRTGQAGFGTL